MLHIFAQLSDLKRSFLQFIKYPNRAFCENINFTFYRSERKDESFHDGREIFLNDQNICPKGPSKRELFIFKFSDFNPVS